jgi:hypothetical protein
MSPDRRAQELQKQIAKEAFKGRRKTDPKPIRWPDDKPFSFWPTLVGLVFGLIMVAGMVLMLGGCIGPMDDKSFDDGSIAVSGSGGGASIKKVTVDGHDYIVLIGYYKAAICPATEDK